MMHLVCLTLLGGATAAQIYFVFHAMDATTESEILLSFFCFILFSCVSSINEATKVATTASYFDQFFNTKSTSLVLLLIGIMVDVSVLECR